MREGEIISKVGLHGNVYHLTASGSQYKCQSYHNEHIHLNKISWAIKKWVSNILVCYASVQIAVDQESMKEWHSVYSSFTKLKKYINKRMMYV